MFVHLQHYWMDPYSQSLQSKEGDLPINASIEVRVSDPFSYPRVEQAVQSLPHAQASDDGRRSTANKYTERQRGFVF